MYLETYEQNCKLSEHLSVFWRVPKPYSENAEEHALTLSLGQFRYRGPDTSEQLNPPALGILERSVFTFGDYGQRFSLLSMVALYMVALLSLYTSISKSDLSTSFPTCRRHCSSACVREIVSPL